ncbi:MAG TPA: O-antigen ligase family protein [Chthoniobacter sp.]
MRRRRSHRREPGEPDRKGSDPAGSPSGEPRRGDAAPGATERRDNRRGEPEKRLRLTAPMLIALIAFGLIVLAGPLLFGAVDRLPQIGLLVLLEIGILAQPPGVVPLSRWGNRLALGFVGLLLFKEFAPANWFGSTFWRTTLTHDYALQLPFTHHPEPSRALDALLAGTVGFVWFLWVRRLASEREHRAVLAWTLFATAAVVAIVSFSTQQPAGSVAIYGLRFTPGWSGFGPFPNRNHSADYFAMAAVLGCGCVTWAAVRKHWLIFCGGLVLLGLIVIALLTTASRGGFLAFGIGFGAYLLLCLAKLRNRRAAAAAFGAVCLFATVALLFGQQVISRFRSHEAGGVSTQLRVDIWHDTLGMWHDAPLLGHGIGSFAGIFPLYQTVKLEDQIVLHPESSWLQWLVELGAIPVLLAVIAVVLFMGRHLAGIFERQRSFFLHAGACAAFVVLIVHSVLDVPGHRWGTAGFALAALAVACPLRLGGRRAPELRQAALVPLAVAVFWWLPIQWNVPDWSPLSPIRLVDRDTRAPGLVTLTQLQTALRYFPLNADLHQMAGLRELRIDGRTNPISWKRHFGLASRLQPAVWAVPEAQARACLRVAPGMALEYWQEAIERGGIHRDEILHEAVQETQRFPAAQTAWGKYVEAHPELLLAYAQVVPEAMGEYYYRRWWKLRGESPAEFTPGELKAFYTLAPRWGNLDDFEEWTRHHSALGITEYKEWASCLRAWGEDDRAWQILAVKTPEPTFPSAPPSESRERLEATWRAAPDNAVNAQQLAFVLRKAGDEAASDEIIITVAEQENPPTWFRNKAAWLLARSGHSGEAVDMLLKPQ